jgi:hypothetical protein
VYQWESRDRYSVEIYEDEEGFVVDYRDEVEICSELM